MRSTTDLEYQRLVRSLLVQVQKTNQKSFVHGRYFKPTAAASYGIDRADKSHRTQKRVTFFCMPFFSVESLRAYKTDKHYHGFPVRSLIQSIYPLESTSKRDSSQIFSMISSNGYVIHVPELWALVIGKRKCANPSTMPNL